MPKNTPPQPNRAPVAERRGIPFYCPKTEVDFRRDPYEQYADTVVRHTAVHLADQLWGGYPARCVLDWWLAQLAGMPPVGAFLEVGCGVGRLLGETAQHLPGWQGWGLDYSYQLLRRAKEFWLDGARLDLDWRAQGLPRLDLAGHRLAPQLQLALGQAEDLPFADASFDLVGSSFLFDRLNDPAAVLAELARVLRPGGRMLLVTPLNFRRADHWARYFPPARLARFVADQGWQPLHWQTDLQWQEPLDARGNAVHWRCVAGSWQAPPPKRP